MEISVNCQISVNYQIHGCEDCPYLKKDTRHGWMGKSIDYYYCDNGTFTADDKFFTIPQKPPFGCPYFKYPAIERIAARLKIKVEDLKHILEKENCEIKELQATNIGCICEKQPK